jgi:hypothetical protein
MNQMNKKQEYKAVLERDKYQCRLCGKKYAHIHHIQFRSLMGADIRQNLVCLCKGCHDMVHSDSEYWKPILLEYVRGHYGHIEINDLKRADKWATFEFNLGVRE